MGAWWLGNHAESIFDLVWPIFRLIGRVWRWIRGIDEPD